MRRHSYDIVSRSRDDDDAYHRRKQQQKADRRKRDREVVPRAQAVSPDDHAGVQRDCRTCRSLLDEIRSGPGPLDCHPDSGLGLLQRERMATYEAAAELHASSAPDQEPGS